jgi:tRNA A-37 threonylcarbamoyl transferase component Bud32
MDRKPTPSVLETVAVSAAASEASDISRLTSSSSADEGRFLPGALLGGRYRIIGLLGRGGMGEVYRATDLALGQAVALKFLPEEASRNPRLLERFHGEVRVARLVSHPNVCRVFDIGEVDGTPFISMEYVDGEDLASLLTRIGRLPSDKALEAARKLCAGLSAAHDRGVIHRDLKPQNIMINKRGDVVIMDFGLAAIADQLSGPEVRNGTPAYMAPEQLRGAGVTQASDIYALGLVLYELFTGKQPYDAKTLQHLIDLQESARLTSMTSIATDVDPAVERIIRRCLDPDPLKRPATALAVSAALPGGDPLAAALAAGETPSPELVANAGKVEGLPRKYSIPCLIVVAAILFTAPWINSRTRAAMLAPLDRSPDVLAHMARNVAASFGYPGRPADSTVWIEHRLDFVPYLRKLPGARQWATWFASEAPIRAIYRESPQPLIAIPDGRVTRGYPPMALPGMVTVTLDGNGRLLQFIGVPSAGAAAAPIAPEEVFRAARLDITAFHEVTPAFIPEHASDTVRAWQGPHPDLPGTTLTVEVASWRGQISQASVIYPWEARAPAATRPSAAAQARDAFIFVAPFVGLLFAILVARRNWKIGRIDRAGALRVAAARFLLGAVAWLCLMHPAPRQEMLDLFEAAAGDLLLGSAMLWIVYLAIEPAVRARYPHAMITWNRVLAGRPFDPQVCAHVLIGAAVGCGLWAGVELMQLASKDVVEASGNVLAVLGTRAWIARNAQAGVTALSAGLLVFAVICFLRGLVRYNILAALATAAIFTLSEGQLAQSSDLALIAAIFAIYGIIAFVLIRFGLVATISTIFFTNGFSSLWLGGDWRAWYTPTGIATLLFLLSIALIAFWKSLGARDLLGGEEA